jgi:hypothetical protein
MKIIRSEKLPKLNSFLDNSNWFRPWTIVLIVTTIYCLTILLQNAWSPYSFIQIGKQFDPEHGTLQLGYDGQFAYQIAVNPLGAAAYLDIPAYRYQRILYPLLARFLGLGNPTAIPWVMILINIISITLGTLATEKILTAHNLSRWFALVYGLFAGQLLSLRLDLTEPLAFMLVQWGVHFFDRKWYGWSGIFFVLAILTRELTILFAGACMLSLFFGGQKLRGIFWGAVVLLPFGLWQVFLRFWLGNWGINSGGAFASSFEIIPFRGWWGYQTSATQVFVLFSIFVLLVALIPATAAIVTGVKALFNHRWGLGVWILLLNGLIFPFLPTSNILNPPGLVRMTIGLVAAVLDYGAFESSKRALRLSLLWLFLLAFGEGLIAVY